MEERRGPFARFLAVSSGLACAYLSIWAIFSHPLGIAGAAILFLAWGLILKLIVFMTEPLGTKIILPENPSEAQRRLLHEADAAKIATTAERLKSGISEPESSSRLLPSPDSQNLIAQARIIGASHSSSPRDKQAEDVRKEDQEWADMFRSL